MSKYGKSDEDKYDQHDEAASTATARTTAAKTKSSLEPTECPIQKEKFKHTRQTSLTIAHGNLLDLKF